MDAPVVGLRRQKTVKFAPIKMPVMTERIHQRIVIATLIAAPVRATAIAGCMLFLQKGLLNAQGLQRTPTFGWNALADAKLAIVARFEHQDIRHAALRQR